MNLLKDKREIEKTAETPIFSFPTDNAQPEPQSFEFDDKRAAPQRKSALPWLAALVIILGLIITYFGFFRNRQRAVDSAADVKIIATDSTRVDSAGSVNVQTPVEETVQETVAPITIQDDNSNLRIASDFMQKIQAAIGEGQVTTLFIDDGSFSAEIAAGSPAAATRAYEAIKQALPGTMTVTSSAPVNAAALITGTFAPQALQSGSGLPRAEIDAKLRAFAQDANASVTSLDISESDGRSFVFMKIEGALDNCRRFIDNLAQIKSVSVSKLIMMPATSGNYTFVLRFYI
ncbi:hypothetical protein JXA02_09885 [candidate division KSB1 bacterium]|nr:hypothetical protein [candidate division KSB1 bacterium]RQW04046.1 MAG: hypothetical protein EH222_11735 [candidate division KSB1 bacterium]